MIPASICVHFFPALHRRCDAGLRAPDDCHGCPAYYDGRPYLGVDQTDQERERHWSEARAPATPRAHFRGQEYRP